MLSELVPEAAAIGKPRMQRVVSRLQKEGCYCVCAVALIEHPRRHSGDNVSSATAACIGNAPLCVPQHRHVSPPWVRGEPDLSNVVSSRVVHAPKLAALTCETRVKCAAVQLPLSRLLFFRQLVKLCDGQMDMISRHWCVILLSIASFMDMSVAAARTPRERAVHKEQHSA